MPGPKRNMIFKPLLFEWLCYFKGECFPCTNWLSPKKSSISQTPTTILRILPTCHHLRLVTIYQLPTQKHVFRGKIYASAFLAKRNQCWGTKRSKLLMCKFRRSPVLLRIILILDLLWFTCLMGGTKSRAYSLNAEKFHGRKKEITNKTLPTGDNQHSSDFFQNHPTKILMNPPYMYIFHATRTPLPVVFEAKAYLTFHHGF